MEKENYMDDMENGQVIGALQDMDIGESDGLVLRQHDASRDAEVLDEAADDLIGEDLEDMEDGDESHHVGSRSLNPAEARTKPSYKGSSRHVVTRGMPIRKTKFLRRGSPRNHGVSSSRHTNRHKHSHHKKDIPMIQSLAISPTHRRDTFCRSYTKNGQYTFKSGYWVTTNLMRADEDREAHTAEETEALNLENICLVDGSWTSTAHFRGMGWVWKDTMGKIQLMGAKNLRRRESALHLELEALKWAMESKIQHSTCQRFGIDCKDLIAMIEEPQAWPNFSTELKIIKTLRLCFSDFKNSHITQTQNEIADSLAMNARSFHRSLCFIGCSIPV
ncbi:hypothetical protein IGI04_007344 [Brassica rapa subsp. trilocularis]|uniref:RNase H type-1 domain-containing protein n=1 Tax=Brassica rapa subsp. trilocularis TaxID=1813537 RepID=A0ABQ7NLS4_BRACM|nr:hypothetical protein IGI04_007344 [Brassica rapa subsp. trilocularis]